MELILILLPLSLLAFWAWMFSDMTKNDNLPQCFITFTNGRNPNFDWTVTFIFLNVFAAIVYYATVYKNK
jgi:cbb3-type cytochrome oxidase subunit 3